MTRIAFFGLGHMGVPMAANLIAGGLDVVGFDLSDAALRSAADRGIPTAASALEALDGADVIITMFPSGTHVLAAYDGADGLLAKVPPGTLFIDSSTISVAEAREAHRLASSAGHPQIDAPVSGGVVGAQAGTLAFMVGGTEPDFDAARPLLELMGSKIIHCGDSGLGQAAKICNNLIVGVSMVAVSEAFVLGEELGLSHQALFDVASNSSGQCWALTSNCPVPGPVPASPANRDFAAGFASALMAKDLGLAVDAFDSTGVKTEVGGLAYSIYQRIAQGDGAGLDFSAVIDDVRQRSNA